MNNTAVDVSIVLVSWNTRELLLSCLASLPAALGELRADVWVIDNASHDGSAEAVCRHYAAADDITVHVIANDHNAGFAAANNQGIVASQGRYVLLLNSDTVAQPGSIAALVAFADTHPRAGIVGPMLRNSDGTFQGSAARLPTIASEALSATGLGVRLFGRQFPNYPEHASKVARRAGYVQGACMLARRSAIAQVGLLDPGYFMYSEETDWCIRMQRAGWEIWYTPDARILHYGGQSTRQVRQAMLLALYRSKIRYFRKHHGPIPASILQALVVSGLQLKWLLATTRRGRPGIEQTPLPRWRDLGDVATAARR